MNDRRIGLTGAEVGASLCAIIGFLADREDIGLWIAVGIALRAGIGPYLTNRP